MMRLEWSVRCVFDNEMEPLVLHDHLIGVSIKMDLQLVFCKDNVVLLLSRQ